MATDRLAILRQMVQQDPNNTFARYGLAMELGNGGQLDEAVAEFHTLLERDQTYCAAYFHGGQALEKLGRVDDAREMYEKGVEAATRKGDSHTRAEIQAALDTLPV